MLISERQLKKIIQKKILKEFLGDNFKTIGSDKQGGIELDDVISDFEDEFKDAEANDSKEGVIRAVRKNNVVLEIILLLLDKESKIFNDFYDNSGFDITDNNFLKSQETKRKGDITKIQNLIKKFNDSIKQAKDAQVFNTALSNLKNSLANYIPKWYPLQWIFFNIDNENFLNVIDEFVANDANFIQPIEKQPIIQLPKENSAQGILNKVIASINNNELDERAKRLILGEMVKQNRSRTGNIRGGRRGGSGVFDWLGDILDNTYDFLMTNQGGGRSQFALKNTKFSSELGNLFGDVWDDKNLMNQGGDFGQLIGGIFKKIGEGDKESLDSAAQDILSAGPVKSLLDNLINSNQDLSDADFEKAVGEILKVAKQLDINKGNTNTDNKNQNMKF